jgi:hypothetical protein
LNLPMICLPNHQCGLRAIQFAPFRSVRCSKHRTGVRTYDNDTFLTPTGSEQRSKLGEFLAETSTQVYGYLGYYFLGREPQLKVHPISESARVPHSQLAVLYCHSSSQIIVHCH